MKRLLLSIGSILLFTSVHGQQVLNLLTGEVRDGYDAAEPVETVESLEDGYLVTWDFTEVYLRKDEDFPDCVFWRYASFMDTFEAGTPAFQYLIDWLEVGDLTPSPVKIIESNYVDYNYQLSPAIPAQPISQHPYEEVKRIPIVPYEGFLPESIIKDLGVSKDATGSYIGFIVYPFQYDYEHKIIRAYTRITLKIATSRVGIGKVRIESLYQKKYSIEGCSVFNCLPQIIISDRKKMYVK